jgi:hypothetical protein
LRSGKKSKPLMVSLLCGFQAAAGMCIWETPPGALHRCRALQGDGGHGDSLISTGTASDPGKGVLFRKIKDRKVRILRKNAYFTKGQSVQTIYKSFLVLFGRVFARFV